MGPIPVHPEARGDGLEDAMEKHMVHELMEQNRLLREKMCLEEKAPHTPPRPTTGGVKRTPGGTRVPTGPPPVDTPEKEVVEETPLPPLPPFPKFTSEDFERYEKVEAFDPKRCGLGRNGDWVWIPEDEKDDRVPDGMRHLQERTMSLEAQVRDLLALQPNGLHRGPQGRDEVARGDRALHGRGQVDCGEDRDWKSQVDIEHLEKLLQEQESLRKRPWFQYGSTFDNKEGGQGRHEGAGSVLDKEVDSLRSTSIQLPSLPQHTGKDTGLVCGDWLAQIRPLLGDMASGALEWWDEMMEVILRRYHQCNELWR